MESQRPGPYESYCTTTQFEHFGRGYQRHCGPTAITNLVLTLLQRAGRSAPEPEEVFRRAAALGARRLLYANLDVLGHWGGTSDLLSGIYLRACMREFGLENVRVGRRRRLSAQALEEAAGRGEILYLQTRRHRRYGNHHLLCYGAYRAPESGEWRLRVSDGWTGRCVTAPLSELPRCHFVPVVPPER